MLLLTTMMWPMTSTTKTKMKKLKMMTFSWIYLRCLTTVTSAESCTPTELVAPPSSSSSSSSTPFKALIYNSSVELQCAWVIRGPDEGDVIGMRVTDWITPSGFTCSRDRLIIRDGSHATSPYLRVLCGAMCGDFDDDTEVVTSSSTARVVYVAFEHNSVQPRGFTLVYRSLVKRPIGRQTVMYTSINYVLMCASVLVIGGLITGLVYLYLRELGLLRLKKRQQIMDKLKRRRPAFSGQSGGPLAQRRGYSDVDLSSSSPTNSETNHFVYTSPHHDDMLEESLHADFSADAQGERTHDGEVKRLQDSRHYHVHGNGTLGSFPPDVMYVQCNGKSASAVNPAEVIQVPAT